MTRNRIGIWLFYLSVFLLPWQTRWIYSSFELKGSLFEYSQLSIYLIEVLMLLSAIFLKKFEVLYRKEVSALILLFGAVFVSIAFSPFSSFGFAQAFHIVSAGFLFIVLLDERVDPRFVACFFSFGLVAPSLLGWFQLVSGTSPPSTFFGLAEHLASEKGVSVVELIKGERILRSYGSFSHPNIFGGYLVIGLILLIWLSATFKVKKKALGIARSMAMVLISSVLITSFSRGAWLALFISGFVMVFLAISKKIVLPKFAMPFLIAISITIVGTIGILHEPIEARFNPNLRLESKSLEERSVGYQDVISIIKLNPFTGVGPGAYTLALISNNSDLNSYDYQPVHNVYLLIFSELGLMGVLIFIVFFSRVLRNYVIKSYGVSWLFSCGLLAALFGLGLFDHFLWSFWSGLALVFLTTGLSLRLLRLQDPIY